MPGVTVTEDLDPLSREEGGYRPKKATFGILGESALQDIPASINVINQDLLEKRQITGSSDSVNAFAGDPRSLSLVASLSF